MPINQRLVDLFAVLNYDTYKFDTCGIKYFTVVDRIFINQERGYIMAQEFEFHEKFIQPQQVTEKIEFVTKKMLQDNIYEAYVTKGYSLLKDE